MSFLLKERICPLLIKLFSPSAKLKLGTNSSLIGSSSSSSSASQQQQPSPNALSIDQKTFGIVSRLIRIVFVLIKSYFELLVTECEIFLSLLVKFLEVDRPLWQKALAIEIFHKISVEPALVELFLLNYDMKQHPEKILALITNGIALFIQSLFLNAATSGTGSTGVGGGGGGGGGGSSSSSSSGTIFSSGSSSSSAQQALHHHHHHQQQQQSSSSGGNSPFAFQISSTQAAFVYKDTTIQLLYTYAPGQVKATYLDGWDKLDLPYILDGYLLSSAYACVQELCKSIQSLVDRKLSVYQQHGDDASPTSSVRTSICLLKRLNINGGAASDPNSAQVLSFTKTEST